MRCTDGGAKGMLGSANQDCSVECKYSTLGSRGQVVGCQARAAVSVPVLDWKRRVARQPARY